VERVTRKSLDEIAELHPILLASRPRSRLRTLLSLAGG
jgi:hypothetical protein